MRILAIDVGTGTQDILLLDTSGPVENSVKMVLPSPTEIAARRIRRATQEGQTVVLTGRTMGGGPSHWALEDHLRSGAGAFATPLAAQTFDDDLDQVRRMGVQVVGDDEAHSLSRAGNVAVIELRDLDLNAIRDVLMSFEVPAEFDGLALGCLDHGAAPADYSDRLFRFDHLRSIVGGHNDLLAFAFLPNELPEYLTRARALVGSVDMEEPLVFLDTGAAAALGALQDERVAQLEEEFVLNLGNMHALGFHLRGRTICSLFEHHTGEINQLQLEDFCERLIAGTLNHEEVFQSKGHGVLYAASPNDRRPVIAVTGPQRSKLHGSRLDPYFAAPHGDMMLSGCFGLIEAFAGRFPEFGEEIEAALRT
jgi:uncharacterized protein (DUF1786 family)